MRLLADIAAAINAYAPSWVTSSWRSINPEIQADATEVKSFEWKEKHT